MKEIKIVDHVNPDLDRKKAVNLLSAVKEIMDKDKEVYEGKEIITGYVPSIDNTGLFKVVKHEPVLYKPVFPGEYLNELPYIEEALKLSSLEKEILFMPQDAGKPKTLPYLFSPTVYACNIYRGLAGRLSDFFNTNVVKEKFFQKFPENGFNMVIEALKTNTQVSDPISNRETKYLKTNARKWLSNYLMQNKDFARKHPNMVLYDDILSKRGSQNYKINFSFKQ